MFFTESTAGLVIYLHTIGLAIKGGVTFLLYKTLKNHISKEALFFMCLLFFIMNPKEILLPEFSNMQIWFEVMLFCCLVVYFRDQNKKKMAAAGSGGIVLSDYFLSVLSGSVYRHHVFIVALQ